MVATALLLTLPAVGLAAVSHPLVATFGSFSHPSGVSLDEASDNVFVADGGTNNAVEIFGLEGQAPNGVALSRLGGFAFGEEPSGLAVDNAPASPAKGDLYVTDVLDSAVDKYRLNSSAEEYELVEELVAGGGFSEPLGVAVDGTGDVFVADYGSESVIQFGPTGAEIDRIDVSASVGHPSSVALDAAGDLFVQGYGNGRVYKYAANGSGEVEPGTTPTEIVTEGATGIAVDAATHTLYVAFGDHVSQYDAAGIQATPAPEGQFGADELASTGRIVVNASTGDIYVADAGKGDVALFGPGVTVPEVAVGGATEIAQTSATVEGTVDPAGTQLTDCHFEYVTEEAFGESGFSNLSSGGGVACTPSAGEIPADSANHSVSAELTGLRPGTTYRLRLLAANASGSASPSADVVFATLGLPFGIEAGSYFAKTNPHVPLLPTEQSLPVYSSVKIDAKAVEAAASVTQAGAHPDATAGFVFNHHSRGTEAEPDDNAKDIVIELPSGFSGDPEAVPPCSREEFAEMTGSGGDGGCPPASQVGIVTVHLTQANSSLATLPVFRLTTALGRPASFGFSVLEKPILLQPRVRSDGDYGLSILAPNVSDFFNLLGSTITFWGVPADPVHDSERWHSEGGVQGTWGAPSEATPVPFLSNPTWCDSGPLDTAIRVRSWQDPTLWLPTDAADPGYHSPSPAPTGCDRLRFGGAAAPVALTLQPAVQAAETPSGYDVRLTLPYSENPNGLADPTLRDTAVVLPEGVVASPSSANGLGACTTRQIGYTGKEFPLPNPIRFNEESVQCPDSSKLGTVEIRTPLLDHSLSGDIYLAKQLDNPFGSLLAIYLAVDDPETGIVVKLAGKVTPDPRTGQLTATFTNNPQLPFTELDLNFFGGPGASLANPPTCGTKTTRSVLTPWSAPYTPAVTSTDSFQVTGGPNGAPCAATESQLPSKTTFEAGSVSPLAGIYTPFVIKLSRGDGTQRFKALNLALPEGLTGRLAGTPYCPDSAIAQAEARSKPGEGALEQASPSCPAASQVGTVDVAAGAGSTPVHVPGKAYLAGPYKGAPLSLVVITPAIAGPFDLGTVVVRTPLYVNEETAQISARSDAFPSILEGIPLDIRQVSIDLSKPEFTYTPSSCEAMAVSGEAITTTGQVAPLQNRFQVGGCRGLEFKPKLALKVFGKTNRNAKPRLRAVLRMKPGEANIARAQVNLPHSLFLEQNHIRTVCTRVQWNGGAGHGTECPKGSIYGHARAITPLLEKPLEGPVYLRSNGGERKLPDLVAALDGQIDIALWGKVDSGPNKGLRNTFEVVPDAPVSKFVLELRGGKKGLLVNSEGLCSRKARERRAIVRFVGHNGAVDQFKPRVANQCKRHGTKSKGHKRQKAG